MILKEELNLTACLLFDRSPSRVKKALYGAKNRIRIYPGQYWDAETGLHYNWFRYYGPEIGVYLRKDPIGFYGGINTYSYTENNPLQKFDPFGLCYEIGCFPTGFNFDSQKKKTTLTDWILHRAYSESISWKTNKTRFSQLHCKWKRKVEITRTFSFTSTYVCIEMCLNFCGPPSFHEVPILGEPKKFSITYKKNEQYDVRQKMTFGPDWPQGNVINALIDVAFISGKEREQCNKYKPKS